MRSIDGLPDFLGCAETLKLRVCGDLAVLRCASFIARFSLSTCKVDWLIERTPVRFAESTHRLPRYINLFGSDADLWFSKDVIAEISSAEDGAMSISARNALTGAKLWEHIIPIPEAAEWAEAAPAWPAAQTEEIHGFIANDPNRLVVCLTRHSRKTMIYSPSVTVDTLPPYGCQTDAIRFDISSGKPLWKAQFHGVHVGIIERKSFSGIWARSPHVGVIDFETGENTVLHSLPQSLGWPVLDGVEVAVPWHAKNEVGIEWLDKRGQRARSGAWRLPRVNQTVLHLTDAGLAIQTNDQSLWWLGKECLPLWNVRAKPYIYRVHRAADSDVFVGTDGNGGRLLALDANSGRETLNLKPVSGGVSDLVKIPAHAILVSTFRGSRRDSVAPSLLVLSMLARQHTLKHECFLLMGTWEHGVVCRAGRDGSCIAVFDVRSPG